MDQYYSNRLERTEKSRSEAIDNDSGANDDVDKNTDIIAIAGSAAGRPSSLITAYFNDI